MLVTMKQPALAEMLDQGGRLASGYGMRLVTEWEDKLVATFANPQEGVTLTVEGLCDVGGAGAVVVDAVTLQRIVASLPPEDVRLEATERSLSIMCGRQRHRIPALGADDYPEGKIIQGQPVLVHPKLLREAILRVAFACAKKDSQPALRGVRMDGTGRTLTLAAADGVRLNVARVELLAASVPTNLGALISGRTMLEVAHLLAGSDGPVTIAVEPMHGVSFRIGEHTELTTGMLNHSFPDYGKLLPKAWNVQCVVNAPELAKIVETTKLYARHNDTPKVVLVGRGTAELWVGTGGLEAGEAEAVINCVSLAEGTETLRVVLNAEVLAEALGAAGKGWAAIDQTSSLIVVRQVTDGVASEDYIQVIAPMSDPVRLAAAESAAAQWKGMQDAVEA